MSGMALGPIAMMPWMAMQDLRPPDVSDLGLEPIRVDDPETNAWTHFVRAGEMVVWEKQEKVSATPENTDPENERKIRECLAINAAALAELRKGLDCQVCVGPEDWKHNSVFPHRTQRLTRILRYKAYFHFRDGDRKAQIAAVGDLIRYGNHMMCQPSDPIIWLLGSMATNESTKWAHAMARDPAASAEDLAAMKQALDGIKPWETGMIRAWRGSFMWTDDLISALESGREKLANFKRKEVLVIAPDGYLFQPNRTRTEAAESVRSAINCVGMCTSDLPGPIDVELSQKWGFLNRIPRQNEVGEEVCKLGLGDEGLLRNLNVLESRVSGAHLVLALRMHELRHGNLPQKLDDLVPEFIGRVPRDPHDGKRFRYLPSRRLVYSVGGDLDDNGGDVGKPSPTRPGMMVNAKDDVFDLMPGGHDG